MAPLRAPPRNAHATMQPLPRDLGTVPIVVSGIDGFPGVSAAMYDRRCGFGRLDRVDSRD